jgi:quercetin dioxygenase-like cupin family protein
MEEYTMDEIIKFKQLSEEASQKILSFGEDLMLVEYCFKKGFIGKEHKHEEHAQGGYVVKGSFEIILGNERKILKQGDTYYAAKNVSHGIVALEDDSIIVDVFTPMRSDFLTI